MTYRIFSKYNRGTGLPHTGQNKETNMTKLTKEQIYNLTEDELDGWVEDLVLGIDRTANTQLRITFAIQSLIADDWPDVHGLGRIPLRLGGEVIWVARDVSPDDYMPKGYNPELGPWVWQQRHGKPYQKLLEEAVGSWRAEPRHRYSRDMNATWSVVEKIRAIPATLSDTGFWKLSRLCEMLPEYDPLTWHCRFSNGISEHTVIGEGPTAEIAICRAALLIITKELQ
jgi:hypothetical protein